MADGSSSSKSIREFDRSLPMSLLKAREAVMREFLPFLRANDLSAQQWRVLRALNEAADYDASQLARRCSILMPSLSRILQNLEGRGLIRKRARKDDQRRSRISITARGRRLVDKIAPISEASYDEITRRFGKQNLESLYEMLGRLIDCLEVPPD